MNTYLEVTLRAKIVVSLIGSAFLVYIIYLLYKRKLTENFALGWITATLAAVSVVVFHPLLKYLTIFSGIRIGALAVILYAFVFILAVLIAFSIKISVLTQQNRRLAQTVAFLQMQLEKLEEEHGRE